MGNECKSRSDSRDVAQDQLAHPCHLIMIYTVCFLVRNNLINKQEGHDGPLSLTRVQLLLTKLLSLNIPFFICWVSVKYKLEVVMENRTKIRIDYRIESNVWNRLKSENNQIYFRRYSLNSLATSTFTAIFSCEVSSAFY